MKHDEFIGQVQQRARLASRGDAERVVRATLQTLGERLAGGEVKDLASQLPPQFAQYVLLSPTAGAGERFNVNEFCTRVQDREGGNIPFQTALFHAQAVFETLEDAVTRGEIEDIRSQLPPEYGRLFATGPQPGVSTGESTGSRDIQAQGNP